MFRTIALAVALLVSGCTASVASLFIHQDIGSQAELDSVPMGWPLTFVHQNLSGYTPMSWPQSFRFNAPQEHPASIHLGWFALNILILSGGIYLLILVGAAITRAVSGTGKQHDG
jgi:hypothetical protein